MPTALCIPINDRLVSIDPVVLLDELACGLRSTAGKTRTDPLRLTLQNGGLWMGCGLTSVGSLGLAVAKISPQPNAQHGQDLLLCFDSMTGHLLYQFDWTHCSALRTAACSALAMRALGRGNRRVLAVVGTGLVAYYQVTLLSRVMDLEKICIYGRNPLRPRQFIESLLAKVDIPLVNCECVDQATADADVICCATDARIPFLHQRHLLPGAHVNALGGFSSETQEVAEEVIASAKVVCVDSWVDAVQACDLSAPIDRGLLSDASLIELAEILNSPIPSLNIDCTTVFKSVGSISCDAIVAAHIIARIGFL